MSDPATPSPPTRLERKLGLLGLAATGICSMLGAGINVVPFMIQRNVPGVGPWVLPAFVFAAVPALLAALAYSILASAMPRAGGSYIYASRGLSPYLGFVASFSQWFGLSIAIGVVAYLLVPFLRDITQAAGWAGPTLALERGDVRVVLALAFLWASVWINLRGVQVYERVLVPLMFLMFGLGAVVIVAGFLHGPDDFAASLLAREGVTVPTAPQAPWALSTFLAAAAVLFSGFIGFDSIAQAGGEAREPGRTLPLAIGLAVVTVGSFYFLFTSAVYHTVPWSFVADRARSEDLTAPGLLGYVLSPGWTVLIVAGAAVALANDLPAMLLSVSRLMFAWAEDGVFPRSVARVHARWHTPHVALVASGAVATVAIFGSHFAGDFFLGVDIMVMSMLVNFLVMCLSVVALPARNAAIAAEVSVLRSRRVQVPVAVAGAALLALFLAVHVHKDLVAPVSAWYFHSTWVWLAVMFLATLVYLREASRLKKRGVDLHAIFGSLPPE